MGQTIEASRSDMHRMALELIFAAVYEGAATDETRVVRVQDVIDMFPELLPQNREYLDPASQVDETVCLHCDGTLEPDDRASHLDGFCGTCHDHLRTKEREQANARP